MPVWINANLMVAEMEASLAEMLNGSPAASLSPLQLHVLGELYEKDAQHPNAIAKKCGKAATSFTPTLDLLEKLNLIRRSPDQNDRRAVVISLTVKGRALEATITKALAALDDWYFDSDWPVDVERTDKPVAV